MKGYYIVQENFEDYYEDEDLFMPASIEDISVFGHKPCIYLNYERIQSILEDCERKNLRNILKYINANSFWKIKENSLCKFHELDVDLINTINDLFGLKYDKPFRKWFREGEHKITAEMLQKDVHRCFEVPKNISDDDLNTLKNILQIGNNFKIMTVEIEDNA